MDELNKDLKATEVTPGAETKEETPAEKTFSETEFKAQLQSETDKRVSQALQTSKAKWEEEYKAKLNAEKSEAEKFGAMTAEERNKAELDAMKKTFEEERQAFLKEKMELQTIKELQSEGLPTEFSSYISDETAEITKANIQVFKKQWASAIENALDERLKGKTPSASSSLGSSITKEQFNKMGYNERAKLIEEDPALYESLKG